MVSTIHEDTHGDVLTIYHKGGEIFIDGMFDDIDAKPAWRGIFTPMQARLIAERLNMIADIMEGK